MKNPFTVKPMACLALSLVAALSALPAQAQTSNIQVFGVLDAGFASNSNIGGGRRNEVATRHESSFWGVRGTEDLGAGLAATFQIERSIAVDTGVDGVRSSTVGLRHSQWGALTIGRQYDLMVDQVANDPARQHSISAVAPGNYDRSLGVFLNNSIKYKSPAINNIVFGALYAVGENDVAAPTNLGRAAGLNAVYQSGPTRVAVTALNVDGVSIRPFNDVGISSLFGQSFAGQLTKTILVDQRILAIGGYQDLGGWRVLGNFTQDRMKEAGGRSERYKAFSLGTFTPVTQGFKFGVGLTKASLGGSDWTNFHAIATYVFSPRTEIYARAVTQRANGTAQKAALFLEGPSSDNRQTVFGFGLTHKF